MADNNAESYLPPQVRIHFTSAFPIETRGITSEDEPAVIEVTNVEYSLKNNGSTYDVTFYVSGIKSFSITDDDQECFVKWGLFRYGSREMIAGGMAGTGCIEMGERFIEREFNAENIPSGDYIFEILYI